MSFQIRKMTAADREAVLEMMRVFYASPAVLSNGSEEIFCRDVDTCVSGSPYLEGYVFADANGIAGYAMLAKSFSTEFGKNCIWIEDLYILPSHRGCGIGSAFLQYVGERYPDHVQRLEVEEENEGAVRVYERSGFRLLGYSEMIKTGEE